MNKPISYSDFQKALQKPIKTLTALEGILTCRIEYFISWKALKGFSHRYTVFHDDDLDIEYMLDLENEFIAEMRKKDKHFKLSLDFKINDYEHFSEELGQLRKKDEDLLRRTRQALSALQRYPNLLFTASTLKNNGVSVEDLEQDLEKTNTELASINPLAYDTKPGTPKCFDLAPLNATDSDLQKLNAFLAYYPRQVEKLELWIREHAHELTFKNAQQLITTPLTLNQVISISNESYHKGYDKGYNDGQRKTKKEIRKQRGPVRKSGAGKKPTYDILDLQCEAFNTLYTEHANWNEFTLAHEILKDPKWGEPQYKKDKPYLYTPGMPEKRKKVVRQNLIKRFKTWRKTHGLSDPFPKK